MSANSPSTGESPDPRADVVSPRPPVAGGSIGPAASAPQGDTPEAEGEATLLQQVMRFRNPDGSETIYATLRGEFEPGQRAITLYVGFCPPFAQLPVVEAEAIEGPPVRVTVAHVQNNGAQIDVRLERPSLDQALVTIELAALPAASDTQSRTTES